MIRNRMKEIMKNRGILGFLVLIVVLLLFSTVHECIRRYQEQEARNIVYSYIEKEMDGDYLDHVIDMDRDVGKVLAWDGDISIRWNGLKTQLATSKSKVHVKYSTFEQEIEILDTFILEKKQGNWSVLWHNAEKTSDGGENIE